MAPPLPGRRARLSALGLGLLLAGSAVHVQGFLGSALKATPAQQLASKQQVRQQRQVDAHPPAYQRKTALAMSSTIEKSSSVAQGTGGYDPRLPPSTLPGVGKKRTYLFHEGRKEDKALLGGKGANLCEMTNIGLPVPPGFIITTETCLQYFDSAPDLPFGLVEEVAQAIKAIEAQTGREFGNPSNPLLFSVRSGAAVSMPGMMDTVLSLGMNDEVAAALVKKSGNPRWVYDTYRRFYQMFANVVMGVEMHHFEQILTGYKKAKGYAVDTDMGAEDWQAVIAKYRTVVTVPSDPHEQLHMAIKSVFASWNTPRAIKYRQYNDIPDSLGTGVTVQSMCFGNMGEDSGTGVMFTRNPSTGENENFGEYLTNACGEDVVAGIRTPTNLKDLKGKNPALYGELMQLHEILERHYRDMQDIEFTVQEGKLYVLQCRSGKRTAKASVKIAVDMYKEGLISKEEALLRIDAKSMDFFLHPTIDPTAPKTVIAKGLPASPGVGTGAIVFNSEEAEELAKAGEAVVLVRKETTAEDIVGMKNSVAILTEQGGMTSHAAVVARGMGKPCVSGCQAIEVDAHAETVTLPDGAVLRKGDVVTVDGSSGEVMRGAVPMVRATSDADFQQVLAWADEARTLKVKANADTPEDAAKARELGAEGIGLCRTEHMYFSPSRIDWVRRMILAENKAERLEALAHLFEFQKEDMRAIFSAMSGFPVTIRLLDPPMHEFLPHDPKDVEALAKRIGKDVGAVQRQIKALEEVNPMLGLRGCRLGLLYPEISEMQVKAVIHAAFESQQQGFDPKPEIMVPLVSIAKELQSATELAHATAKREMEALGSTVPYKVGTMLELPRACLIADTLAPMVEFFSFGTNDLTQSTFGFSRDDVGGFLPSYLEAKTLEKDPFETLDRDGVGQLMRTAVSHGRAAKGSGVLFGICGEHGGDPSSVLFCQSLGLDYTSCSPFRVPIARIAAAQAAIRQAQGKAL